MYHVAIGGVEDAILGETALEELVDDDLTYRAVIATARTQLEWLLRQLNEKP